MTWQNLLAFHKCGNNMGVVPFMDIEGETIVQKCHRIATTYFNLFRGNIGEDIVSNLVDFTKFHPSLAGYEIVEVGMIVEEKGLRSSLGVSPDLLLVNPSIESIIPVEIKCIEGEFSGRDGGSNGSLRREVEIASKQLGRCSSIIRVLATNGF
jgi:hypothetical protein